METKQTKCPFFKMIFMCFPGLKKNPTPEQQEVIELVNEVIDEIQEQFKAEFGTQTEVLEKSEQQTSTE